MYTAVRKSVRIPGLYSPEIFKGGISAKRGSKGCTLVTVEQGEVASVEHRAIDVMRWSVCKLDVAGCATVDDIYEQARDELQLTLDAAEGRPVAVRLLLYKGLVRLTPSYTLTGIIGLRNIVPWLPDSGVQAFGWKKWQSTPRQPPMSHCKVMMP